jgi:hypothetical protein
MGRVKIAVEVHRALVADRPELLLRAAQPRALGDLLKDPVEPRDGIAGLGVVLPVPVVRLVLDGTRAVNGIEQGSEIAGRWM